MHWLIGIVPGIDLLALSGLYTVGLLHDKFSGLTYIIFDKVSEVVCFLLFAGQTLNLSLNFRLRLLDASRRSVASGYGNCGNCRLGLVRVLMVELL